MLYHPSAYNTIRLYIIRDVALCVLIILCGILAEVILFIPRSILLGIFGGMYFVIDGISIFLKYRSHRLSTVDAVIVSAEQSKTFSRRTITTYRAIPVDENGEFCDRNGRYDFFIEVDTTKRRFGQMLNIGAIYRFVFNSTDDDPHYSSNTLLIKYRSRTSEMQENSSDSATISPSSPEEKK